MRSVGHCTPTAALCCPRRFVSDQAPTGMAALCQHKLLGALEQTQLAPGVIRAQPPTQLEWTAGWRRGRMALDVFTFNGDARLLIRPPRAHSGAAPSPHPPGPASCLTPCDPDLPSVLLLQPAWGQQPLPVRVDPPVPHSWLPPLVLTEERFSAEVESWTTGEQFAGWILWSRYGGPGVGGVWPTLTIVPSSSWVLLTIPAHSPTKHLQLLLQAQGQSLLPEEAGRGGEWAGSRKDIQDGEQEWGLRLIK